MDETRRSRIMALIADPRLASDVPSDEARALLAEVAYVTVGLGALHGVLLPPVIGQDPGGRTTPADAPPLISPERAANIADLIRTPKDTKRALKRIYHWARGKKWAHRPNRKTLLIDEQAFRRWLVTRG